MFVLTAGPAGIPLANCIFGKLDINKEQELANFHFGELPVSSKTDMIKRINEKHKACGPYKLFSNNCEHLATYVRYGDGVSLQVRLAATAVAAPSDISLQWCCLWAV